MKRPYFLLSTSNEKVTLSLNPLSYSHFRNSYEEYNFLPTQKNMSLNLQIDNSKILASWVELALYLLIF